MRIFLLGYMGSGKSTLGKKLAAKLKLDFFDLDTYIEEKQQKTISEIFATDGEQQFRIIEKEALNDFFDKDNVLIATGGGAPCFFDNISQINKNGRSIYLELTADELALRLKGAKEERPIIKDKTDEELRDFIQNMLNERNKYYQQASIIYHNSSNVFDAVDQLKEKIEHIK